MRFAVIGKGFIFERHKQSIESLGHEVSMTCDIDESKNPTFTDWVEMFNHPDFDLVDAVVICTPNYLHSTISREALLKGKKVLCEKPLSINGLEGMNGVNTVLQLRHHPELKNIEKPRVIYIEAKMYRNDVYWNSWKGNKVKSGSILFNLGVHYIDLAIFLLGDQWKIKGVNVTDKCVEAIVEFRDSLAKFHIEIVDTPELQGRKLIADGREIVLSNQENLSYEDLHTEVYKDFIEGRGVGVSEAKKAIDLIEAIYANAV